MHTRLHQQGVVAEIDLDRALLADLMFEIDGRWCSVLDRRFGVGFAFGWEDGGAWRIVDRTPVSARLALDVEGARAVIRFEVVPDGLRIGWSSGEIALRVPRRLVAPAVEATIDGSVIRWRGVGRLEFEGHTRVIEPDATWVEVVASGGDLTVEGRFDGDLSAED